MKLTDFNDVIQNCFGKTNKEYIDILYFGKKGGMEVAICKVLYESFLINLNKGEILSTLDIEEMIHVSKTFDTFEEASSFVMSQDRYSGLEISSLCERNGEFEFFVNMDVPLELSNERIIKDLLKKIQ